MTEAAFFPPSTTEARGIQSSAILAFVDAAERSIHDLHSFILLRRGTVVAEAYWGPFGPAESHMLFSLSKSFTSTAIGLLVAEGRLSIDDHVIDFFPDEAPAAPSDNLRAMRVRHLLTMSTGHNTDPTGRVRESGTTWTKAFLAEPVEHQPGTHFVYNSVATYMLSAIAQRLRGERLVDYLEPRLFGPLGIAHPIWETSPEGIDTGGWGLSVTTRDIARFGQLYLQRGVWQGKQLLPEAWVEQATSRQVPNGPSPNPDWEQGYGFQFWRCRHGAYRGDGAFGQFCVVMPDQEAVLAMTAGLSDMQAELSLFWEHLLPALDAIPAPDEPTARLALADRLETLHLAPAAGQQDSPMAAELSGREYALVENADGIATIGFRFATRDSTITLRDESGEQSVPCGHGRWALSIGGAFGPRRSTFGSAAPSKLAASGAWVDHQTYVVELIAYETPFRRTLTCRFAGDRLTIDQETNVSFGPTELPRLEGRAIVSPATNRTGS